MSEATQGVTVCRKCGATDTTFMATIDLFYGHPPGYWLKLQEIVDVNNRSVDISALEARLAEAMGLLRQARKGVQGWSCADRIDVFLAANTKEGADG